MLSHANPIEQKQIKNLKEEISLLIDISRIERENTSIIVSITELDTRISYIPRDVRDDIDKMIRMQSGDENTLLGYGIGSIETLTFLEKECGISGSLARGCEEHVMQIKKQLDITSNKTVILTTSTKHIRMLVNELK
jgi:hypothetical protein